MRWTVIKFKVDGFDYTNFATTETMKCFGCGQEGHLVHSCHEKNLGTREWAHSDCWRGRDESLCRQWEGGEGADVTESGSNMQQNSEAASASSCLDWINEKSIEEETVKDELDVKEVRFNGEKWLGWHRLFKIPNEKQSKVIRPKTYKRVRCFIWHWQRDWLLNTRLLDNKWV